MITDYKRAKTLREAQSYVDDGWDVLAGGGFISKHQEDNQKVVDLQDLGLSYFKQKDNFVHIGAMTKLQEFVECTFLSTELIELIKREKSFNIRNAASIAGTLISSGGRSDILAWFICANAKMIINDEMYDILTYLDTNKKFIVEEILLDSFQDTKYEKISRTPDDSTIVGVFLSKNKQTQKYNVVLNGFTETRPLYINSISRNEIYETVEKTLINSRSQISNQWSSFNYQKVTINNLIMRLLGKFSE